MTDPQPAAVASTYQGLADLLGATTVDAWDAPSLCEKWLVRHVVAHVTMPVRLTPETFGAEMAAAGGDFTVLSDDLRTVAPDRIRDVQVVATVVGGQVVYRR